MHGNSLRGVSLTRTAHPAGLGPLAEAGRVAVAGRAPAGAVHPRATVRAATATGTRPRSRNRPGGRDIGPTPSQTLTPRGNRRQSTYEPHRATAPRGWPDPWSTHSGAARCRSAVAGPPARGHLRGGRDRCDPAGSGTRHPAGRRPVPAVVRQLDEHRLPELIVAAVGRDMCESRPRPAASRIRLAQARRPAHLRRAGPLHPRTGALRLVSSKEADT